MAFVTVWRTADKMTVACWSFGRQRFFDPAVVTRLESTMTEGIQFYYGLPYSRPIRSWRRSVQHVTQEPSAVFQIWIHLHRRSALASIVLRSPKSLAAWTTLLHGIITPLRCKHYFQISFSQFFWAGRANKSVQRMAGLRLI